MRTLALMMGQAQPGGREPAPGGLGLVQAFVNTAIRGWEEDLLDHPARFGEWLEARDLPAATTAPDRAHLFAVREALHRLLADGDDGDAARLLTAAADRARLAPAFAPARLEPRAGGVDAAVGTILAAAWSAMADGSWRRLKVCPGDDCGWAFYDRSVNASATWCSMRVCGQRAKARSYYRRSRGD